MNDIAESKELRQALARDANGYKALMEAAIDGIHVVDQSGRLVDANPAFLRMLGYEKKEALRLRITDWDVHASPAQVAMKIADLRGRSETRWTEHRRKDGTTYEAEVSISSFEASGKVYFLAAVRDITERKANERRLRHQTRLYAMLSHTNQAIVRAHSEQELFHQICRIAVEQGGMLGATVRLADLEARLLRAVAYTESMRSVVEQVTPGTEPAPGPRPPLTSAFLENQVIVDKNYVAENPAKPWQTVLHAAGVRSAASLPLRRGGVPIGVFTVNAVEADFFDSGMRSLLEDIAADLEYVLDNFEYERRRKKAEQGLRESEEKFRGVVEQAVAGVYVIEGDHLTYVNGHLAQLFGYRPDELIGRPYLSLLAAESHAFARENMRKRESGELRSLQASYAAIRKDGSKFTLGVHGTAATIEGRRAIIGLAQDISEREQAQQQISAYMKQLESSMLGTVNAVSAMLDMRDPYTAGHERRVAALARAIGAELGLADERLKGLEVTCLVHDIGKIAIPSETLAKPGRLSQLEFEIIKTHARAGYEILKDVRFPWPVAEAVLQHHERMDGSGYPRGLKGDEIILEARIIAVADVVEAMGSHRPYRPTLGVEVALEEITRGRGNTYDARVADACLRLFHEKGYELPR